MVHFTRCAVTIALAATSALAHSHMHVPTSRGGRDYAFMQPGNACESENTDIPQENNFVRGQTITPEWFWNNHDGGFIKFALIKGVDGNVDNAGFLLNENIIQGQCYTGACDRNGFDPGNTRNCLGKPLTFPNWLEDGEYTLQWSQIGGYNSDQIATKQLPLYHTCANIRISGGEDLAPRPNDWIAPFQGGSQDVIRGEQGGDDVCGFKAFNREPEDPREVDVNRDVFVDNMQFGKPDGWAVAGTTNCQRADKAILPRLGRVARNNQPSN